MSLPQEKDTYGWQLVNKYYFLQTNFNLGILLELAKFCFTENIQLVLLSTHLCGPAGWTHHFLCVVPSLGSDQDWNGSGKTGAAASWILSGENVLTWFWNAEHHCPVLASGQERCNFWKIGVTSKHLMKCF